MALGSCPARAQIGDTPGCDFDYAGRGESRPAFPKIPLCAFPGAYQDSSLVRPRRCVGSFAAAGGLNLAAAALEMPQAGGTSLLNASSWGGTIVSLALQGFSG